MFGGWLNANKKLKKAGGSLKQSTYLNLGHDINRRQHSQAAEATTGLTNNTRVHSLDY